jgi:hypothetical protein
MNTTKAEKSNTPIHSLIRDRKLAFANLVRAYLKFNVAAAKKVEIAESENKDVFIAINDNVYKFDVSDYTGCTENYIFFNPSSGRLVIQGKNVSKVYKLEVDLFDNND